MSFGDVATRGEGQAQGDTPLGPLSDRLSLGVAARLSRYLQVLTQARKMGKETISSQELSEYTHVNSTQIRRDLSGFGKFGKRGVGYNVDSLVSQIRKILRTSGQHNIALFGAGHLGRAIASSDIFADHGFRVVAMFDSDRGKVGEEINGVKVRHTDEVKSVVVDEDIVVGVLAVPTVAAQELADPCADDLGIGVEDGDHLEAVVGEDRRAGDRLAEVAGPEEGDVVLAGGAEDLADLGDQRVDVVADAPLAELAEPREVAANLGRVDVRVVGQLLRGNRVLAHLARLGQHLEVARESRRYP